jgi:uncharacterized protein (UPF0264 family)
MTDRPAATSPFGLLADVRDGTARDTASRVPRLLVSVRNAEEARAAIAGGCDILDVKEPNRGSLGLASLSDIESVIRVATKQAVPCSVALGEAAHWLADCVAEEFLNDAAPDIRPDFLKLGLACLGALPNWVESWESAVQRIEDSALRVGCRDTRWVAVIYADWQHARFEDGQQAHAPCPDQLLDAVFDQSNAFGNRFAGVLVDTYSKSSGTLLDALSIDELRNIAHRTRESGRFLALAGRLSAGLLEPLRELQPDVIAIRSAACRGSDRTATVDVERVAQFRTELQHVFSPHTNARITQ